MMMMKPSPFILCTCATWFYFRLSLSVRGPRLAIVAWLAALVANLIQVRKLAVQLLLVRVEMKQTLKRAE